MTNIDAHTKISFLLRKNPDALDTIISISPKFEKLRNPLLRKLLAGRASIAMAAQIAGCTVQEFMNKLEPFGFQSTNPVVVPEEKKVPQELTDIEPALLVELDVREMISQNRDPLPHITKKLRSLKENEVLKIINSFEPRPLMALLEKQGYGSYAEKIHDQLIQTYFFKKGIAPVPANTGQENETDWDVLLEKFKDRTQRVDVRDMEMPQPMMTILEALEKLPPDHCLFVYHKRIPVFLIPELKDRNFDFRFKQVGENEVHLLIFRKTE